MTRADAFMSAVWSDDNSSAALWITTGLWMAGLWSHFRGLEVAAATPPVLTPLPSAIPAVTNTPK